MNRGALIVLVVAFFLAMAYDVWVASEAPLGLGTCPPFFGTVSFTLSTSGFQAYVAGPLFTGHQLVLAPGSSGTVTIRMTSDDLNLTDNLGTIDGSSIPLGPFGAETYVIDVSKAYRTSTVWNTYVLSPNETGISVSQVSLVRMDDYNYTATYRVQASPSARPGTYQAPMFFNGWCSTYYLTIGTLPYMGTINGTPQSITLLLPFLLVALLGCGLFALERWTKSRKDVGRGSVARGPAPTGGNPVDSHG